MRRVGLLAAEILLALALAAPTLGADGTGKSGVGAPWTDQAIIAAADRVLSTIPDDAYQIDPAAVWRLFEAGAPLVIDVREQSAWQTERIGGTIQIALRDLPAKIDRLPSGRGEPMIVVCQAGIHGTMAMTVLRMLGYTNVRNLRGGLNAWKAAGYPVVTHDTK